jgi:hypothetical protein
MKILLVQFNIGLGTFQGRALTGIVGVTGGDDSPRELSVKVKEGIGAVQVNGASSVHVCSQNGIVEACARVVRVNVEVVVFFVGGTGRLEVEVFG